MSQFKEGVEAAAKVYREVCQTRVSLEAWKSAEKRIQDLITGFKPPDQANLTRIVVRAPNGCRFSFWGNEMYFECPKGEEFVAASFLAKWIDEYVYPVAQFHIDQEAAVQAAKNTITVPVTENKEENNGEQEN